MVDRSWTRNKKCILDTNTLSQWQLKLSVEVILPGFLHNLQVATVPVKVLDITLLVTMLEQRMFPVEETLLDSFLASV